MPDARDSLAPQLLAFFLLIQAASLGRGFYDDGASLCALAAIPLFVAPVRRFLARVPHGPLLAALCGYAGWLGYTHVPALILEPDARAQIRACQIAAVAVLAAGAALAGRVRAEVFAVPLVALALLLRVAAVLSEPRPELDSYVIQNEAAHRLLLGESPYGAIYTLPFAHESRGGTRIGGQTYAFPKYTYLPGTVLAYVPAAVLGIDYRWTLVALDAGTLACLFALGRGGPPRRRLSILYLAAMHPVAPSVFRRGWNEPLALFSLAVLVLALRRRPALAAIPAGLAFTLKQYLPPMAILVLPALGRRRAAWALLLAAAISVPMIAMDPGGFWSDTVLDLVRIPPRTDSVSLYALAFHELGIRLPAIVLTSLTLAAIGTLGWPIRTAQEAPRRLGLYLTSFFFVNKQAFGNYYWLCACLTLLDASSDDALHEPAGDKPPPYEPKPAIPSSRLPGR
ncbi:MAG: glycosyltransferase 87 family protein [Acidobacteriota bacterium]